VLCREDKILLARLLDGAGVHQIEAGIPAMGGEERDDIRAIRENRASARVSVWNRAKRGDVSASFACRPDIIHICLPVSEAQMRIKLGLDAKTAPARLFECLCLALDKGYEVSAGFEDASRAETGFLRDLAGELRMRGVARVRLSDTVGVLTPGKTERLVRALAEEGTEVEFHAHNDLGMADANSLRAATAGALFVDTTVTGIGERAGNCHMRRFARLAARHGGFALSVSEEAAAAVEREAAPLLRRGRG
jgi:homocitrate synthase NifV